ncbi:hypothetical protein ACVW0P_003781 [Mucilaginibacter sp. UYNi724]
MLINSTIAKEISKYKINEFSPDPPGLIDS